MHLNRLLRAMNLGSLIVAGVVLCVMVILAVLNVVLGFFGEPVKGTFELMGYGGALITALALGDSQFRKAHIQVNVLECILPGAVRRISEIMALLVGQVFFLLVAWRMFSLSVDLKMFRELSETLHLPYYRLVFIAGMGFVLLVFNLSLQMAALIRGVNR